MSGIVSRLSVLGKVWLGLAAGALALIVFGLAAPGSSLFFPLVSLWCNAALFALALLVLRRAGVELDLFHKAVLVGLWAAAVLYFYWVLGSRTFLYHWDYVNYILKQYHAEAAFAQSTGAGFRFLLDSITEDYTSFITLFTEFPFCLSGKTGDDYAFCQVFSVLPSLLVLLAGLLLLLLPTGKSSGQERQASDDTQLYSLEETEQRMAQLLGKMSGVGRVQVMLTLKTGPTLQLAQDMDLEQEEGSLRQRSQPVTVNRGSGWQEALVTRQDYPVYQGAVVVCQGADSSAVRLAVTEAVAALTGLSTEKITVVQWEQ